MQKMSSEAAASRGRTVLHGPTMGTRWSVTLDADGAVDLAALHDDLAGAVAQVDAQMSPWKPDSDLMRLNRAAVDEWVPLADEILEVLDTALQVQRLSGGAFHPCAGDLVDAWGFGAVRDCRTHRPFARRGNPSSRRRLRAWRWTDRQAARASIRS